MKVPVEGCLVGIWLIVDIAVFSECLAERGASAATVYAKRQAEYLTD
jgi:hypothetical protein